MAGGAGTQVCAQCLGCTEASLAEVEPAVSRGHLQPLEEFRVTGNSSGSAFIGCIQGSKLNILAQVEAGGCPGSWRLLLGQVLTLVPQS